MTSGLHLILNTSGLESGWTTLSLATFLAGSQYLTWLSSYEFGTKLGSIVKTVVHCSFGTEARSRKKSAQHEFCYPAVKGGVADARSFGILCFRILPGRSEVSLPASSTTLPLTMT